MAAVLVVVSILIKLISLLMVVYAFNVLSPRKEPKQLGILTKYFLVKRKYTLLRFSLLFVAAMILLELGSLAYALTVRPASLSEVRILASDLLFLGLIILLTRIYGLRATLEHELEQSLKA